MIKTYRNTIESICAACSDMSDDKIGALIVFERDTNLGEIVNTGTYLDARISDECVRNLFYPKAPLHDGAVVIRDNRVCAAGCILPLSESHNLNSKYGTRHRAAIGITEQSDAVVVVVSEETGNISIVENGFMNVGISDGDLREMLTDKLIKPVDIKENKFRKMLFKHKKSSSTEPNQVDNLEKTELDNSEKGEGEDE
jgi:diadenylate cyclase